MMNEANNNNACSCCSSAQVCTQAVNAPLCEARRCSAQSAMAQAKKQTLKQPMKQAIKQRARECAGVLLLRNRIFSPTDDMLPYCQLSRIILAWEAFLIQS